MKNSSKITQNETEEYFTLLPIPGKIVKDSLTGEKFIGAAQNSDRASYRKPSSTDYFPTHSETAPKPVNLKLETQLNALFLHYAKQYTSNRGAEFVPSFYITEDNKDHLKGAGFVIIKPPDEMISGRYQSSHFFDAKVLIFILKLFKCFGFEFIISQCRYMIRSVRGTH